MKKLIYLLLFLLFMMSLNAQQHNYETLWHTVETFEIEGLPKSALEVVETISKQAKKENNAPQRIKTLIFKSKFALILEEDAQLSIINDFKHEIKQSTAPTKNILEGLLANLYWQYFNQNRWRFYNRTKTLEKADTQDFRTWDLQTLFNEIHLHYQNALQNASLLQNEALSRYDMLLHLEKNSKMYRPTLFDFLSHQALAFYKTDETRITKPAYKFKIDNPDLIGNALTFSTVQLHAKDSTSLQLNALKIFQALIKYHLNDKEPYALTAVNIERLNFVHQHATFSDKEDCFLETLEAESKTLKSHEASGLYDFEMASILYQQSKKYQNTFKEKYRWKAKEALAICNQIITQFPKSKGAERCAILKAGIEVPTLQIKSESYVPIQTHARLLVHYRNIDTLTFRIFKLKQSQLEAFKKLYNKEQQLKFIKNLNPYKRWESQLKNENDYQTHSTEVLMPQLDNGIYLIFASHHNDEAIATSTLQATHLALVEMETERDRIFQIINRNNGNPIKNAKVELHIHKYKNKKTETHYTNAFGEVSIKKNKTFYQKLTAKVNHGNDVAYFYDHNFYPSYYNNKEEETVYQSFLFTDRSIYRPGQTVYFKSILLKKQIGKSKPLVEETVSATLYNTNGEKLSELDFETNTYGSVSGEFILPNTGLNGEYYIKIYTKQGTIGEDHYFLVEEYKRPKFQTTFQPVTKTFKVNDSITVKGSALAYAGSNITDAKVVYRVHRKAEYPHWYFWYYPSFKSQSQEIVYGETTTNSQGEFKIIFKAQPDESVDKHSLPIFNYEITAEVTDLNGETRTAITTVKVGYHALIAKIHIEAALDKTKKDHTITIDTKNLNGEFVPAKGTIKIYKLNAPNRVLRPRPWAAPDYQTFSKDEFEELFPHDAYKDEHLAQNWEKGDLVLKTPFDTKVSQTVALNKLKTWQSGQYLITLESKDAHGQNVKDEAKITLYSPTDTTLADKQLFNISSNKSSYHSGETAVLTLASAAKNLNVTLKTEKDGQIIETKHIQLNNNKKPIAIPVETKDVGGFVVHYSFAAYNSFKSGTVTIAVPYPITELNIETETFRDKLQPGTEETWRFKISGPQGEKVSAELLASMYDASLDQFTTHQWMFNPIRKPVYYTTINNKANLSFGTQNFRVYNQSPFISYPAQEFDSFNWFGFSLNNSWYYRNYVNALKNKRKSKHEAKYDSAIKKGYVSGVVFDQDGNPLAYANILVKNTTRGTTTNFDGSFSIQADKDDRLLISFIGCATQEIIIKDNNNSFNITLENSIHLQEVAIKTNSGKRKELSYSSTSNEAKAIYRNFGFQAEAEILDDAEINDTLSPTNQEDKPNFNTIKIRKNLQETAFFFPHLQTDTEGRICFNFTTPEALTQWKLQLLAHTKTLESATKSLTTVTQKELMVLPNAPRFLREGDTITISTKIANLTEKPLSGQAKLILTDAISGKDITTTLLRFSYEKKLEEERPFTVSGKGNTQVSWQLRIPDTIQAVQYKILAKSKNYSDGEQNTLPVLSNRMLVTETLPMWINSNETRTFTLDKLKTNHSTTLKHHQLTLEITSNPAWYAVQALPYLMEYPYQCNEQTFSRYYANALASHIANANPRIQQVFKQWKNTDALVSNLEKNQELKSILIQDTPWLRDAQSEAEQKKRIALLFDLNKMTNELQSAANKLKANQMSSGAWAWFKGGRANRYITQHIITGFGHLRQLSVTSNAVETSGMTKNAIQYLDAAFVKEYRDLKKYNPNIDLTLDHLSYTQLHYLYMRSFYPEIKKSKEVNDIIAYYQSQIQKYWLKRSLYAKGLMALITHRNNDSSTANKILKSLKETSITNDELGMYWKANTNSWYWYQAPIETHALLIEAFAEIQNDTETIDYLKIWLLKNKQTNKWKTTKATADAVYALLLQGSDWLSVTDMVDVVLGDQRIAPSKLEDVRIEAGTGYYKTSWSPLEIKPKMAEVTLTKKGNGMAWGSLYWQYFEDLDKITSAETPLKLKKQLFVKRNTDRGEEISEITKNTTLKVGDLVRVRIELQSDRNMEFIHMKDMRAAGLEPVNVLSRYKWQDGLGYYESTKDASTNFFFDYLPKGVYVFEYDLRVNNAGNMSNGITTIQSMYAPEFSSHSEGVRVLVN